MTPEPLPSSEPRSPGPDWRWRLGCAVWSYPGWVGSVYPPKTSGQQALRCYGDRFWAVEGNTTFYGVPSAETVRRWGTLVPDGFQFCLKMPRDITHMGPLVDRLPAALAFAERAGELGDRRGPIFAQLPPSYGPKQAQDLREFLALWRRSTNAPLALEVRHREWFLPQWRDRLNQWLREWDVGRVVLDTRPIYRDIDLTRADPQAQSQRRKPELPLHACVTADYALVRFISHPEPERNQAYLQEWCDRLVRWFERGIRVYFFVHCPIEDHSPHTARALQALLEPAVAAAGFAIAPLPWNQLSDSPAISSATPTSLLDLLDGDWVDGDRPSSAVTPTEPKRRTAKRSERDD